MIYINAARKRYVWHRYNSYIRQYRVLEELHHTAVGSTLYSLLVDTWWTSINRLELYRTIKLNITPGRSYVRAVVDDFVIFIFDSRCRPAQSSTPGTIK